jgi:hypothetical protein
VKNILLVFYSLIISFNAFALSSKEIYKNALNNVALLSFQNGHGTGFFISNGFLVTNHHVIDDVPINELEIKLKNGETYKAKMLIYDNSEEDIAILLTNRKEDGFVLEDQYEVGEKVYTLGNPGDLTFSITDGILSRLNKNEAGVETIQFSAPAMPGSSGSPIINEEGNIIGILHSIHTKAQGFTFGTSSKNIKKAIHSILTFLDNEESLHKKCENRDASSCELLANLLKKIGLIKPSLTYYKKGCDLNNDLSCYKYAILEFNSHYIEFDKFKLKIENLCRETRLTEACKLFEAFDELSLKNNQFKLTDFNITLPTEFKFFKKEYLDFTNDQYLIKKMTENTFSYGGWINKSEFQEKFDGKIYIFFETISMEEKFKRTINSVRFKDFANHLRNKVYLEDKNSSELYEEVKLEKTHNKFPYHMSFLIKYKNGKVSKDLYLLGDRNEMVLVSFESLQNDIQSVEMAKNLFLKNLTITTSSPTIQFDKGQKYRVTAYAILVLSFLIFVMIYFLNRKRKISVLQKDSIVENNFIKETSSQENKEKFNEAGELNNPAEKKINTVNHQAQDDAESTKTDSNLNNIQEPRTSKKDFHGVINVLGPSTALIIIIVGFYFIVPKSSNQNTSLSKEVVDNSSQSKNTTSIYDYESACSTNNNGVACNFLGYAFDVGDGQEINPSKAFEYYTKSCNLENGPGCFNLGTAYQRGAGTNIDQIKAFKAYEKSCKLNDKDGCNGLGISYRDGIGTTQSNNSALRFFERGCTLESGDGCANLGDALDVIHSKKALEAYEKACRLENGHGCGSLGGYYWQGIGTEIDHGKAFALFEKACLLEDGEGCKKLGRAYSRSIGTEVDEKKALEAFEKSCKLNYAIGCLDVAYAYRNGLGANEDQYKAQEFTNKACSIGFEGSDSYCQKNEKKDASE